MSLLDLKHLYNTLDKKLLLFDSAANMLKHMDEPDREAFFLDPEYFNPLFTYEKNVSIKRRLAKLLQYHGTLAHGDQLGVFLYKREEGEKEYTTGGLLKRKDAHTYVYEYLPTKCKVTLKQGTAIITEFALAYTPESLLTYAYEQEPEFFQGFISRACVIDTSSVKLTLADPQYNKFDKILKIFQNTPVPNLPVAIQPVLSKGDQPREVIVKYGLPNQA